MTALLSSPFKPFSLQLDDCVKSIIGLLTMITTFKGKQTAMPYTHHPHLKEGSGRLEVSNVTILKQAGKQHLKKDVFGKGQLLLLGEGNEKQLKN
ncbi:hypothetical protein CDAR_467321 [Caerostris darwini]|uniref:Uncharacterized protein n=1 Tax=Caerostris darwini TaxID=1538125 RepID=A0AAV4U297_9ARAC|nr:hypothetical protein CDAR_467321 [Caerostris darwini]